MMHLPVILIFMAGAGPADDVQGKPPAPDPDRPAISTTEIKALRDNNIFAPRSATLHGPRTPKSAGSHSEVITSKPKPPMVTGIFLDPKSRTYQMIVEDRNESGLRQLKMPKFLKDGDEWGSMKVESVKAGCTVCTVGGSPRVLHVGDALPEGEWKSDASPKSSEDEFNDDTESSSPGSSTVAPSGVKSDAALQSAEERNRVLNEMKRKNGKKSRPKDPEE